MILVPLIALAAGAALAGRWFMARHVSRNASRLPVGPDGIIPGAQAIDLPRPGAPAVLMLHGFGDTPQTLRYVASALHDQGYAVRVPLLPGHGRTLAEFVRSSARDWIDAARTEYAEVRARHPAVVLLGLSMGGGIAAILAADGPRPAGLVLAAPYLHMPTALRLLARAHRLVAIVLPVVAGGRSRSIMDPEETGKNLAYRASTPRLGRELLRVVDLARDALPGVAVPTLMVQSREDNRIVPDAAEDAYRRLTTPDRQLVWVAGCAHIITVDYCRERVIVAIADWLRERLQRGGTGSDAAASVGGSPTA
jgi:carboxylesterase